MEQEFGERLKRYRKEKNMTQQELADALGVSNKTVSRWESGGGYPDVAALIPLARALGVTADDLLDEEKPVRTLTKQDWQSLLSFAFALGGGVLFFLFRLFVPAAVCYLGYLGCMAYGVYLQRYYCYQSKWFRMSNLVMDFFVNLYLAAELVTGGLAVITLTAEANPFFAALFLTGKKYFAIGVFAAALVLTVITVILIERLGFANREGFTISLNRSAPRQFAPAAGALLLLGYWLCNLQDWPLDFFKNQLIFHYLLLGLLTVLCICLFWKQGRRWGMVPTAVLLVGE